jgi:DNA modification methylase
MALEEATLEVRAQLIWNKPTAALGWGDYRWKHEPFYYAGKKETKLTFYGDRTHATVLDFHDTEKKLVAWVKREKRLEAEGKATIWTMKRDKVNEYLHPTQKPVELITYAIVNSSKEGDVILDPFLGSGSTVIAAEKTARKCYGVELDPSFADVIVQRWVDYTGVTEIIRNGEIETWQTTELTVASPTKGTDV